MSVPPQTVPSPTPYAIEVADVVKTYPGGVRALDGLSFAVQPGQVFGLLGPNGAGKSTTMKILTTLARPDSGSVRVAGHDALRRPDLVRRAIGVVAQRSGADPMTSGRENLVLQGRLYGLRGAELSSRVEELLDRFDLGHAARREVRTYSGGMQRRLDVALGMVHMPRVLFLDEPTTGLDPESRTAMWDEIERMVTDNALTILLTTHHLEEVDRLAHRLAIVDHGRIVVAGTPEELKGELRGDALRIELSSAPDARGERLAREVLATLPGLREVTVEGRRLGARADAGAAAVPMALAALDQAGLPVAAVTVARPSMDDVYLRHVGRRSPVTVEPIGAPV
ncbi:ATP-binding cassette domain-containing protein [Streptomyces sp. NPDC047043]|uniref:ATP-binding cassette domain-containing protein n=1 Tax=Streptomyces sp. NPDC047043 TaxID=3154497 RepID=UPI0033D4AE3D